jgi:hypothetical protein
MYLYLDQTGNIFIRTQCWGLNMWTCNGTEEGSRDDPIVYKLHGNYEFLYKNENWKKKYSFYFEIHLLFSGECTHLFLLQSFANISKHLLKSHRCYWILHSCVMLWNPDFDIKGFISIFLPGKLIFILLLPCSLSFLSRWKKVHQVVPSLSLAIDSLQQHHRFHVSRSSNCWETEEKLFLFSGEIKRHTQN